MKAIKVITPGKLEICEEPMPEILNSKDVLIKVKAAGICGSDVHIYHGTSPVATYPRVIGHEIAGEVVKIGSACENFKIGDHVVIDPVISCGDCYPCSKGRGNVCANLQVRGVHVDGGYAEYVAVPERNIYKVSDKLSFEEAALVEPFTVAAQVASRGEVTASDTVLILGSGPIALTVLQVVKMIGAKCIITDLLDSRLEIAKQMGADLTINSSKQDFMKIVREETNGLGANVVIDAVGLPQTFEQAVKLASSAGIIVTMGFDARPSNISQLDITKNELDIRGSRLHNNKFPQVIEWFNEGKLNPKQIISHRLHFTEVMKAFEIIQNNPQEVMKIILSF